MEGKKHTFHNQFAKNFVILAGLVLGGWFLYYSFAPPEYAVQYTTSKENQKEAAAIKGVVSNEGIFQGNGFRMKPPSGWGIGNAAAINVDAVFINPIEDKTKTKIFHSNINVVMEQTTLSLDEYVKLNRETLEKSVQKYSSTKFQKTTVNGNEAYMIGGTFTQNGEQLRNHQLVIVTGGIAYIATGTALDSAWSKYAEAINAALASFDL